MDWRFASRTGDQDRLSLTANDARFGAVETKVKEKKMPRFVALSFLVLICATSGASAGETPGATEAARRVAEAKKRHMHEGPDGFMRCDYGYVSTGSECVDDGSAQTEKQ